MKHRRSKIRVKPASSKVTSGAKSLSSENTADKQPDNPLHQPIWQPDNAVSNSDAHGAGAPNSGFNATKIPSPQPVQAKLTVGAPNDKFEQEADRVADQVMRMPEQSTVAAPRYSGGNIVQRTCSSCAKEYDSSGVENRDVNQENLCPQCRVQANSVAGQISPLLQRQEDIPENEDEEKNATLQSKPLVQRQADDEQREEKEEEETLQADAVSGHPVTVTPGVNAGINSMRGRGQPLPLPTRAYMEPRFGHDFGNVRIHSDDNAAKLATQIKARAFTVGRDIAFGAGYYQPFSSQGKKLLAHELTHVVQQQGAQKSDNVYRSPALGIRQRLRINERVPHRIQRLTSWGGDFTTKKYKLLKIPGFDGVDIDLRFKPNKYVNAELIALVQTVQHSEKGVPFSIGTGKAKKTYKGRMIPSGQPGAGTQIDQYDTEHNPLYAATGSAAGQTLASTPTGATWGQHGTHYKNKAGKLVKKDAKLLDAPKLFSTRKQSKQIFETAALAVKGEQVGTYYGSVQWGWEKNAAGKVSKIPFKLISSDVPSNVFFGAAKQWNKQKSSSGTANISLPIVYGRYVNTRKTWLVRNPSTYKKTIIGKLDKNTRLEVTDKGVGKRFNRTIDKYKWWKVTIVEGTQIGKVGWVMQTLLSKTKTKKP